MLIDHDVRSNYGCWSALSGLGPGKVNFFNTLLQSKKFDRDGVYIKRWVPELSEVPPQYIHDVWNHSLTLSKLLGDENAFGSYPKPIATKYSQSGGT
jgi:deoxyribodipyrimidine photo-lyase